jgi:hypothetical protein
LQVSSVLLFQKETLTLQQMRKLNASLRLMSDCQLTLSPTDVAGGIYFHYVALN